MDAKRIIPVLQVFDGRVQAAGDPAQGAEGHPLNWASRLALEGADGIIFHDHAGSGPAAPGERAEWIRSVAGELFIPFALEADFTSVADLGETLLAGADKVILGAGAVPFLAEAAQTFGRSRVAVAVDAVQAPAEGGAEPGWRVAAPGPEGRGVLAWMAELEQMGAGEILLRATPEGEAGTLLQEAAQLALSIVFRSEGEPDLAANALLHGADGLAYPAQVRSAQAWKPLLSPHNLPLRH
jgi:imidazole glycerol phosphate synthase subunit HisF